MLTQLADSVIALKSVLKDLCIREYHAQETAKSLFQRNAELTDTIKQQQQKIKQVKNTKNQINYLFYCNLFVCFLCVDC